MQDEEWPLKRCENYFWTFLQRPSTVSSHNNQDPKEGEIAKRNLPKLSS